jgi:hypothetical protein
VSECNHELHEMDAAAMDGLCALCLQEQLAAAKERLFRCQEAYEAVTARAETLEKRLAEEIKWGHQHCTINNCVSSGVDCPKAEKGSGE